jgi:hypothetical protein
LSSSHPLVPSELDLFEERLVERGEVALFGLFEAD